MTKYIIDPSQYEKIRQMYETGMTMQEIGEIYCVSRQAISLIMIKMGMKRRKTGKRKTLHN